MIKKEEQMTVETRKTINYKKYFKNHSLTKQLGRMQTIQLDLNYYKAASAHWILTSRRHYHNIFQTAL